MCKLSILMAFKQILIASFKFNYLQSNYMLKVTLKIGYFAKTNIITLYGNVGFNIHNLCHVLCILKYLSKCFSEFPPHFVENKGSLTLLTGVDVGGGEILE